MPRRDDVMSSEDATMVAPPLPLPLESSDDATMAAEDPSRPAVAVEPEAPRLTELLRGGPGGKRLGHYLLLGELGRGGMGVVLSAYDETLDRKVAIKVLQTAGRTDAHRRLVREAQAMARLSHPNVVQIYEIGELGGPEPLTFIVMEFIDGSTLGDWRGEQARTRAEILDVFIAAGRGLAAAHKKGLVHRDFKPDNVMIRKDGRVVVMDFGLAREGHEGFEPSTEVRLPADALTGGGTSELSVDLTATGALMGTPAYMSPEQFKGEATDAKTDQFSFCVALWEALFGERPFSAPTLPGLSLAVTRGELRSPERGDLPSWLMRVLERGLAVSPDARWPAMDDLLAALSVDPTRRRRWWIVGLGMLALVAAALVGARVLESRAEAHERAVCAQAARSIDEVWNPEVRAELDARFASTAAIASWTRAGEWMDAYVHDWADLHERSCVEARVEHTRGASDEAKVSACLDDARVSARAVVDVWKTADLRIVAHAAMAAANLTPIAACEDDAWLAQRVTPPEDPQTRAEVERIRGERERIEALTHLAEYEAGREPIAQLIADAEALGWKPLTAELEQTQARIERNLGDKASARESYERASLVAFGSGHDLAALRAVIELATLVGYELGEVPTGRYWAKLGFELLARLGLEGTIHEAKLHASLGDIQWTAGEYDEALASYHRAHDLAAAALGDDHPDVAIQLANIGYLHMELGEFDVALEHFREAKALAAAALGPEHPNVAAVINYEADALRQKGEYELSLELGAEVLRLAEVAFGTQHPRYASALSNYATQLANVGRRDEAIEIYERVIELIRATNGDNDPTMGTALNNLAGLQIQNKDYEAGEANLRRGLAVWEANHGPKHKTVGLVRSNIGSLLVMQGEVEEGIAELEAARDLLAAAVGPEHPLIGDLLTRIAQAHVRLGDDARARELLDQAIALLESNPKDRNLYYAYFELAQLLGRAGKGQEARELGGRAREWFAAAGAAEAERLAKLDDWLTTL